MNKLTNNCILYYLEHIIYNRNKLPLSIGFVLVVTLKRL